MGCKKIPLKGKQLNLPLVIENLIDIYNPVYTFLDVINCIGIMLYFEEQKSCKADCLICDVEKLCNNDIRFKYLLDEMKAPTFATLGNFIHNKLTTNIEDIFNDINSYLFDKEKVDLNHTYIDGTKIEANARHI